MYYVCIAIYRWTFVKNLTIYIHSRDDQEFADSVLSSNELMWNEKKTTFPDQSSLLNGTTRV